MLQNFSMKSEDCIPTILILSLSKTRAQGSAAQFYGAVRCMKILT